MRSLALFVICLVATAISLAGCAEESPSRDTRGTPPTANSATDPPQTQVAATTGTIRGVVRYVGKKPEPKVLDVSADPYCAACWAGKGGGPISERWPFGENDTLKNVLVYISDGLGDREFTAPSEPALVAMKDCQYVPHVTTVQVGQPVIFHNEDRTLHNVHLIPLENPEKGVGQPGNGIKQEFKLRKPEVGIYVKCGVHAWMFCIVHVMAHPHYDITREAGTFEIADVPPGEYELTAWQEFKLFKLDEEKLRVRVVPGEVTEVTFTFRPKQGEQQDR